MRIRAALLAAALLAQPATAQTADDARAAIGAVLAHQVAVRGPESGAQTCVVGQLAGPPAKAGEDDSMAPDFAVRIGFQWHVPESPATLRPPPPPIDPSRRRQQRRRPEPVALPPALPAALAAELDAQRAEAVAGPSLGQIDATLVPPPLLLQGRNNDCAPLMLSEAAFAGDTAFVAVAYACGTTCGNGSLYALRRNGGRWEPVGVADIWIR